MKTIISIGAIIIALVAGGAWLTDYLQASSDPDMLATRGMHEHPTLAIYVKGERVPIPENIGVGLAYGGRPSYGDGGMAMTAIHTHDDVPVIHLEFSNAVRKEDIMLGKFFDVWGRDMQEFGENVRMTVNGDVNTEYENYVMHDGDKIELHYD